MKRTLVRWAGTMVGSLAVVGGALAGWQVARPIATALAWALSLTGLDAVHAIAAVTSGL